MGRPMTESESTTGRLCWVGLSTSDLDAAVEFYGRLFPWSLTTHETPMGDDVVVAVDGREIAGMMARGADPSGSPSVWTAFFFVDDLDSAAATVVESGGSVLADPVEIPDGARISVIADPHGATLALISEQPHTSPYLSTETGGVSWVELMTRHPDDAMVFYRDVFGWDSDTEDAGGIPYTVFRQGETQTAGMVPTPDSVPGDVPDNWSVYFTTDDCAGTVARAESLGGLVILPPTPTPAGPFAVLADPIGAVFQIMEYAATP